MIDSNSSRVMSGHAAYRSNAEMVANLRATHEAKAAPDKSAVELPAVIKTISSSEENNLQAEWDKGLADRGHAEVLDGEAAAKRADALISAIKQKAAISRELTPILRGKENLAENERRYAKVQSADPVPAKELTGDAKTDALNLIRKLGYPIDKDFTQFNNEGTRYRFYGDGRVETNDADVPTSREEKAQWLETLRGQIANGKRDPSALMAERDALAAHIKELESQFSIWKDR